MRLVTAGEHLLVELIHPPEVPHYDQQVKDGFGFNPRDGGAADMMDSQHI